MMSGQKQAHLMVNSMELKQFQHRYFLIKMERNISDMKDSFPKKNY